MWKEEKYNQALDSNRRDYAILAENTKGQRADPGLTQFYKSQVLKLTGLDA